MSKRNLLRNELIYMAKIHGYSTEEISILFNIKAARVEEIRRSFKRKLASLPDDKYKNPKNMTFTEFRDFLDFANEN